MRRSPSAQLAQEMEISLTDARRMIAEGIISTPSSVPPATSTPTIPRSAERLPERQPEAASTSSRLWSGLRAAVRGDGDALRQDLQTAFRAVSTKGAQAVRRAKLPPERCTADGVGVSASGGAAAATLDFVVSFTTNFGHLAEEPRLEAAISGPSSPHAEVTMARDSDGAFRRARVRWSTSVAGQYNVAVRIDGSHILESPFAVPVHPGPITAAKSVVTGLSEVSASLPVVVQVDAATVIVIRAVDQYGNRLVIGGDSHKLMLRIDDSQLDGMHYRVSSAEAEPHVNNVGLVVSTVVDMGDGSYEVHFSVGQVGVFRCVMLCDDVPISNGKFDLVRPCHRLCYRPCQHHRPQAMLYAKTWPSH